MLAARAKLGAFDYCKTDARSVVRQRGRLLANIVTEEITMLVDDPLRQIGTFEQKFLYYRHRGSKPRPTVILLTLFGEAEILDKLSARFFCRNGFNVLLVIPAEALSDSGRPFDQVNDLMIRHIITARMGVDMLERFPETDPERIFAYGTSMGGMRAAMLFGVEPRIRRAGVVTAGGDLPGIVSDTEYGLLREIREARMAKENIPDLASLRAYLNKVLTVDPIDFACLRDPEDISFVISSSDQYVKHEFQQKLFDAFSRPSEGRFPAAIHVRAGHLFTGGRFPEWTTRTAKFFHAY